MAFTFNGAAKTISFTGGSLSVREMWSRYIDWLAESDNSKYLPMLRTVGMDTPDIPLYVFLELGVTLIVTNTAIPTVVGDGVLKTDDARDPFGGAVVNVRYEAPGIAIGYSTSGSAGPTADSIAAAIGQRVIDNGLSNDALLRILLAALAGKTAGLGTDTEQYLAQDGITPRITAQFDANNNRTSVTLNGA